jgi:hypothetical protein
VLENTKDYNVEKEKRKNIIDFEKTEKGRLMKIKKYKKKRHI